jgi:hypothetical protein
MVCESRFHRERNLQGVVYLAEIVIREMHRVRAIATACCLAAMQV